MVLEDAPDGMRALLRDPALRVVAAAYVACGIVLPALGAAVARINEEHPFPGIVVAAHGAFFGLGLVALGAGPGRSLVGRFGATRLTRFALALLALGVGLVAVGPAPAGTLPGAAAIGGGVALLVLVLPPVVRAHPAAGPHAFADVNALFALGAIAGPGALVAAAASDVPWRLAFGGIGGAAALAALALALRAELCAGDDGDPDEPRVVLLRQRGFAVGALVLVAGACVESCIAFWSATFALEARGDSAAVATLVVVGFTGGQAVGRLGSRAVERRVPPALAMPALFAVASAGSALLVLGPGPLARVLAGVLVGLGTSLIYPRALGRLFDLVPRAIVAVSAAGALASGLAVAIAPLVVGAVADATSLVAAMAIVPVLAGAGVVLSVVAERLRVRALAYAG